MKRGRPDVERILTAFNLEEPDRVPFFELSVADSIKEAVIGRPPLTIHDEMEFSVKIGFDVVKTSLYWVPGVERQASSSGREYVVGGRVRCREDLERLRLTIPDPDDPALYEEVERAVKAVEGSGLGVFTAINACWEIRHCMDMPFFLASIYRNPGLVEEMMDMYAGFYAKVVRNLSQIGVDFIFVTEDIAYRSGPFVSPEDMGPIARKIESTGNTQILLTERGTTFGYHDLVTDFRSLPRMRSLGHPVCLDPTHIVRRPGIPSSSPEGGTPEFVFHLVRAGVACGIDALFVETHPHPPSARCDACSMIGLHHMPELVGQAAALYRMVREWNLAPLERGKDGFVE